MYMGGRNWRPYRPPPKPSISIPNFPYPKFIFSYLMSQSAGYNITFTTPKGDSGKVDMPPDEPEPAETSEISSTAAPTVTPAPTTRPAFSTGLTTPPGGSSGSSGSNNRGHLPPPPYVQPGVPAFWVAAIWAMAFVNDIGPIDDYDTLKQFYSSVASKIKEIMGDGTDGAKNVGALIYFCTTTSILFEPFMSNFTYNFLNANFPKIFNDTESISGASKYNKIVMINYYSVHASEILKPNRYPGNGYIPISEQKVIKYAVPDILKSILDVLNNTPPLAGL
jgi:hypothetical protein